MDAHLVIVWRVTTRCNLACGFCAYDRSLPFPRAAVDEAAALAFGALVAGHTAASGRRVLVSWLGGEPLLWPALTRVSEVFRAAHGFDIGITTNGHGLEQPRWRAWALDVLDQLTVSLDGLAPFHDAVRVSPGAHGRVLGAIERIAAEKRRRGRGPLLRVNTILMRQNVADFPALCEALASAGVEEVTVNQLGGNDRPAFYPDHRLLPPDADALCASIPALRARFAARGMVLRGGEAYLGRLRATARGVAIPVDDCGPGQTFWFVDEAGRLSPCSFTSAGYGVPIETLHNPADLCGLPTRWAAMRERERLAPCLDCHSTQVFDKFQEASPPG